MNYTDDDSYPTEPIGDGNPYYRCAFCKRSTPEINGRLEKHLTDCEFRIARERQKAGGGKGLAEAIALIERIHLEDSEIDKILDILRAEAPRIAEPEAASFSSGCPCTLIGPCSANCTCANPCMSGGCSRCASHGSMEQRQHAARHLAALEAENARLRDAAGEMRSALNQTVSGMNCVIYDDGEYMTSERAADLRDIAQMALDYRPLSETLKPS